MVALIIIILSVFFSVRIVYKQYRQNNGTFIFFVFTSLFFVQIPLLADVINYNIIYAYNTEDYTRLLNAQNERMLTNYYLVTNELLLGVSVLVFLINTVVNITYNFVRKNKPYKSIEADQFYSDYYYIIAGIIGVVIFVYLYGLDLSRVGVGYRNDGISNKYLLFLMNLLVISSISGVLKKIVQKKYLQSVFFALPIVIVGYLTTARSLMVSVPLIFLYYVLNNKRSSFIRTCIVIVLLSVLSIAVLTSIRESSLSSYPINRDISFYDLYYSFFNVDQLDTQFSNFIRLITTGLPFFEVDAYDITEKLADQRIGFGWGTLHPTFYGWLYIDAGWLAIILSSFFGFFLAFCDNLRDKLPTRVAYLFLPFQLSFIPVLMRGSIQYAYSNIIYIVILCFIIYKYSLVKNEKNSIYL